MKGSILVTTAVNLVIALGPVTSAAQAGRHTGSHDRPQLHVSDRWEDCSFQLDATLTQEAWARFAREAGLVVYFRPLADARPMGKGKFEVAILQWQTNIDDRESAWNDTFVHPDSTHWLFEGAGLKFPGLMVRGGVSNTTDVGLVFTRNPKANYGVAGLQVQRRLIGDPDSEWAASIRVSAMSLFGPDDLDLDVLGWDVVGSRTILLTGWASLSPYAGISSYLSRAHEKSALVNLDDEYQGDARLTAGTVLELLGARVAVEYSRASVNSVSVKVGFGR